MKCKRCNGIMIPGKAFRNDMVATFVPDFPGDTIESPGQTITLRPGPAKMVKVYKCKDCGRSILPSRWDEENPLQHT